MTDASLSVPGATSTAGQEASVNWDVLRAAAVGASRRAYAPYSRYPVGAAALTTRGRLITGCNVENASYGLVLCAECGVVSALLADGGRAEEGEPADVNPTAATLDLTSERESRELFVALTCVDGQGEVITPCGRCRQLLWEHAAPGMVVAVPEGECLPLAALLPQAFGPEDVKKARGGDRSREPEAGGGVPDDE